MMKPDAELRMMVYQEGQRAFNAGIPCPYADWRAGTWEKGRLAAQKYAQEIFREEAPREQTLEEKIAALEQRVAFLETLCQDTP